MPFESSPLRRHGQPDQGQAPGVYLRDPETGELHFFWLPVPENRAFGERLRPALVALAIAFFLVFVACAWVLIFR